MDFRIEHEFDEEKTRWRIKLSGEIDIFNSAKLKNQLNDLLEQQDADLSINCESLDYIDSTALGALVSVMKNIKNNGKEMHLLSVKPNLMRLFRITHLDQVFKIEEGEANE